MVSLDNDRNNIKALCQVILLLETENEVLSFLQDLCTPTELSALAERWQICKALNEGLSYREINTRIGASLTTIGRVARFLKDEPYQGYNKLLAKINQQNTES